MVAVSLLQGNSKIECKVTWQDDNVAQYNPRASVGPTPAPNPCTRDP
jgi:hypothetical protein